MISQYDTIGIGYNVTRKADSYLVGKIVEYLKPISTGTYLDIGCGTGNYSLALHAQGYDIIGIDPSEEMLTKARFRSETIQWKYGSAEQTGLESDSVDGILAFLTMHHWYDLPTAFTELSRVLKTGEKMVVFTSTPEFMRGYWLNHYFPIMMENSITQMPDVETVTDHMKNAGFSITGLYPYFIQRTLEDHFLYCGKDKPALYFKNEIRNGISSFAALANKQEVEKGLRKLQADLNTGMYDTIKEQYNNTNGDYLFVVAQKK